MNIEPKSDKPIIKRLRETAADLLSEKTYIACAGCDNHNSAEVGKDIRWALREIKRLNTLLSGLYATAQANHDANAKIEKQREQQREDTKELEQQDALIASMHAAGNAMKVHLEPRRVSFSRAARESTEAWDSVVSVLSNQ